MIKKGALVDKTKNQRALARHQNLKLKPYIESEAAGKSGLAFFHNTKRCDLIHIREGARLRELRVCRAKRVSDPALAISFRIMRGMMGSLRLTHPTHAPRNDV